MLISSADGGFAINDAVRVSDRLVDLGRRLAGLPPLEPPKSGAQFHFSLPGSVQGFMPSAIGRRRCASPTSSLRRAAGRSSSATTASAPTRVAALTPTFAPPDVTRMRTYELMATPLLYPGQSVSARVIAGKQQCGRRPRLAAHPRLRRGTIGSTRSTANGSPSDRAPKPCLRWRLPDTGGQPIQSVGLALRSAGGDASGAVVLDYLRWDGPPDVRLRRPDEPGDFWRRAWVNAVSIFSTNFPQAFRISQDRGEGMIIHGGRQWTDYRVRDRADRPPRPQYAGVGVRVQGLRRYYAAILVRPGLLRLIRVRDDEVAVLAEAPFAVDLRRALCVRHSRLSAASSPLAVGAARLEVRDESAEALADGGVGADRQRGRMLDGRGAGERASASPSSQRRIERNR